MRRCITNDNMKTVLAVLLVVMAAALALCGYCIFALNKSAIEDHKLIAELVEAANTQGTLNQQLIYQINNLNARHNILAAACFPNGAPISKVVTESVER